MWGNTKTGYGALYTLSELFFLLALAGIALLIGTDILHHYRGSILHQKLDAVPLIAIGLSYICLNLATADDTATKAKGIFLGLAFLFWGGEQLLPPSRLVTFFDEGAVTIFVVDLSLIVWQRIRTARSGDRSGELSSLD